MRQRTTATKAEKKIVEQKMNLIRARIEELLVENNMTRAELAKKAGYTHVSSLNAMLRGDNNVNLDMVIAFERVFKCEILAVVPGSNDATLKKEPTQKTVVVGDIYNSFPKRYTPYK